LKISKIAAGMYHSIAVTTKGDLYCWGRGEHGVLGLGSWSYHL